MGAGPVARRQGRRAAVRRLLEAFDPGAIDRWASAERAAWATLQPVLFDPDALLRWRAVEAAGLVAAARARDDLEAAREPIRRALWLMNDESGGVLWVGPEVIGAVLAHVPALQPEFLEVLASFLEEEPFRPGARWALWRVALASPGAVASAAGAALAASLADPDPAVRGHAALALAAARGPAAAAAVADDPAPLQVFDPRTARLRDLTVGEAARGEDAGPRAGPTRGDRG